MLHYQHQLLFLKLGLPSFYLPPVKFGHANDHLLKIEDGVFGLVVLGLEEIEEDEIGHGLVDELGAEFEFAEEQMEMLEGLLGIFLMHRCTFYIFEICFAKGNTLKQVQAPLFDLQVLDHQHIRTEITLIQDLLVQVLHVLADVHVKCFSPLLLRVRQF